MNANTARLLFVFILALFASVARGDKQAKQGLPSAQAKVSGAQYLAPVQAGMGFFSFAEKPKKAESIRIIYSDEEVEIVDLPDQKQN
jgi:hypothetical protein